MPQTKEEILKEAYGNKFAAPKYENSVNREMIADYVLPAMDEYAEQQSTAFLTWAFQNHWRMNVMDNTNLRWTNLDHNPPTISTRDLYKLFQDQQSITTQTEQ